MKKGTGYEEGCARGAKKYPVKFDLVSFYLKQLSSLNDPTKK